MIRVLGHTERYFRSVAFSPDGRRVVSGSGTAEGACPAYGADLTLTDVQTGEVIWQIRKETGYFNGGVSFVHDGSQILTVDWQCDDAITVWDAATGQQIGEWAGHQAPIMAIATSPNGRFVATGSEDATTILWDAATGTSIYTLPHEASVETVGFSSDSSRLMTVAQTGIIRIWDTATGQMLQQLTGHTSTALFVQFSPSGHFLLSSGSDNNILVWDLQSGEVEREFNLPLVSPVGSVVAFSPDGQSILMTDENDIIRQIDLMLDPGELLDWVRQNRHVPELTCEQRVLYRLEPLCSETLPINDDK